MEVKEIERRFLLKKIPKTKWDQEYSISQYYIQDGDTVKRLRFTVDINRKETIEYLHKIQKGVGEFVEVHEDINQSDAYQLVNTAFKVVNKVRRIVNHNGLKFEVDKIDGIELVLLEVELDDINQGIVFPPIIEEQIIMEVTGIRELSNANLATSLK
jgi:CYTH domain-containing protein